MKRVFLTQVPFFVAIRIILHTPVRMVYPFLTIFESGIGVSSRSISWALALRSASGAVSPFLGSLADHYGRKSVMLFGLVLFTAGTGALAAWPTFPAFVAMLLLTYSGGVVFMPALQAYLGDCVPYQERGLALGLSELGWSFSFILGVPTIGWIIAQRDWRAPFPYLTLLGVGAFLTLLLLLPKDPPRAAGSTGLRIALGNILASPAAVAAIGVSMAVAGSNELMNLVFGLWLDDSFHVKIGALAIASAIIGLSELGGEIGVSAWVDRLGKARAVGLGLVMNGAAVLILPWIGSSLNGALVGLFLLYLTFEFTIVSCIPLMTELIPSARATLIASFIAGTSVGRAAGAFFAPLLYRLGEQMAFSSNLILITLVAASLNLVGLILLRVLRGR